MVPGKLAARKIAPSPNSNANRKPNPDSDWGKFSLGAIFQTPWDVATTVIRTKADDFHNYDYVTIGSTKKCEGNIYFSGK